MRRTLTDHLMATSVTSIRSRLLFQCEQTGGHLSLLEGSRVRCAHCSSLPFFPGPDGEPLIAPCRGDSDPTGY